MSAFQLCDQSELMWLDSRNFEGTTWDAVRAVMETQPRCDLMSMPCTGQTARIAGMATVKTSASSDPYSGFGHLGSYKKEIFFTQITGVRALSENKDLKTDGIDSCLSESTKGGQYGH